MVNRFALLTGLVVLADCGDAPQAPATAATSQDVVAREGSRSSRTSRSSLWSINREGVSLTMRVGGEALNDPDDLFFQSLGSNGRSCHTCHEPQTGMTLSPRCHNASA